MSSMITGPSIGSGVQTYQGTQTQAGTGQATSQNQYTPTQQQLQGTTGNSLLSFLQSGAVPGNLTAPPSVINAYEQDFQNWTAPQIAAQYGAGSPQLGAQESLGMQNLLSNLYQQGVGNYLNSIQLGGNMGYNPVGAAATNATQGVSNVGAQQQQGQSLLSMLLNTIGGII